LFIKNIFSFRFQRFLRLKIFQVFHVEHSFGVCFRNLHAIIVCVGKFWAKNIHFKCSNELLLQAKLEEAQPTWEQSYIRNNLVLKGQSKFKNCLMANNHQNFDFTSVMLGSKTEEMQNLGFHDKLTSLRQHLFYRFDSWTGIVTGFKTSNSLFISFFFDNFFVLWNIFFKLVVADKFFSRTYQFCNIKVTQKCFFLLKACVIP